MVPLLTFYGDDFTGSSAVMEVLSFAGIPTMLFMELPSKATLENYPDLKAIGVAGVARSKDPEWMRTNLPPVLKALKQLDAPLTHYKVCSTFDSSPQIGSIGTAAEIGADMFKPDWMPLVVGAPAIGRFQVFGNLFASANDGIHRLDRHPVMASHPVTPMDEADLGQHLAHQTGMQVGLVDVVSMTAGRADDALRKERQNGSCIVALDVMNDATLHEAGRLIWESATGNGFAIGSQGIEYALVTHWREIGLLPAEHTPPKLMPVDQLFAVSGSCAPTTATQIARAEAFGFEVLDFDASAAVNQDTLNAEVGNLVEASLIRLSEGRDVLVTTARGPDDPSMARMATSRERAGISSHDANEKLGRALGTLVAEIRARTNLSRIAIGGGDTSGHALTALNAEALSAVAPLAPGAPLCKIHSQKSPAINGLEVTLKGGQMGSPDFFIQAKTGTA